MGKYNLYIPNKEFKQFLSSVAQINANIVIKVKDNKMEVLTGGGVLPILILATINLPEKGDNDKELDLPIVDVTKIQKVCEFNNSDELHLEIDDNVIKYKSDSLKIKLHLAEQSIINVPKEVTSEKFRAFPMTFSTVIDKDKMNQLKKGMAFMPPSTVKVHFFTENGKVYGEISDKESKTSDVYRILLSDSYEGQLIGNVSTTFTLLTMLKLCPDDITLSVSTVVRKNLSSNILFLTQETSNSYYSYLIKPLASK